MDKKAIVIIPHYNHWDLTHARLWELYKHEKENIKYVLVVNDSSTDKQTEGGLYWWYDFKSKTNFDIRAIKTEKNVGFLKACNAGFLSLIAEEGSVEGDDTPVILLSNDVIIRGKFIEQIFEILESNPKSLVGGVVYSNDTGWNRFGDTIYPYAEGWLLATSHVNWWMLGYFDEQYIPNDFEDVDLSTKALSFGYELVPLNNVNLQHLGGQSIGFSPEREKITNENKKKFEDKWVK